MNTENMKWIRLEWQGDAPLSSHYIILHTHLALYSHLLDQGYVLNIFYSKKHDPNQLGEVLYIQTNHQGFFESCLKNYAHDFLISGLGPHFIPESNFSPLIVNTDKLQRPA